MTEKNKIILKTAINYTASAITAVFIFLFCCSAAIGVLCAKNYIKLSVKSADYIALSAEELKEDMISLAIPSGLPEKFFDDKIDSATLLIMNNDCIDNAYDNGKFSVDTADVKQYHINIFKRYAESGALASDTDVTDESIGYLAQLCTEKYDKIAANSVFKYLSFYAAKINKFMPFAIVGTLLFSVFCIAFLLKIGKAQGDKRYLYYSLCGAGVMSALAPSVLLIGGFIKKVSIASRAMHLFIISFVNNILLILVILGIILIALAVFFLLFKNKNDKKEKNS